MTLEYIMALEYLGLYERNSHFSKIEPGRMDSGVYSVFFSEKAYFDVL